jgi:hypothetical protein
MRHPGPFLMGWRLIGCAPCEVNSRASGPFYVDPATPKRLSPFLIPTSAAKKAANHLALAAGTGESSSPAIVNPIRRFTP